MHERHDAEPTKIHRNWTFNRAANLVIKRHGADAVIEAARMVDACWGDLEGRDLWRRIRRASEMLQAPVDRVRH